MSDQTPAGAARVIKTKRITHVVTSDELGSANFTIDVPWDAPFVDLNYTADCNVECAAGNENFYFVDGFSKRTDGITVSIGVGLASVPGDTIVIHGFGIRD